LVAAQSAQADASAGNAAIESGADGDVAAVTASAVAISGDAAISCLSDVAPPPAAASAGGEAPLVYASDAMVTAPAASASANVGPSSLSGVQARLLLGIAIRGAAYNYYWLPGE
jgi:hypothetical protein